MDRIFGYLSTRGFVAVALLHPFYKLLRLIEGYALTGTSEVILPVSLILSLNENLIVISMRLTQHIRLPLFKSDIRTWKRFRWLAMGILIIAPMACWLVVLLIGNGIYTVTVRVLVTAFRCWSTTLAGAFRSVPILIAALVIIFTTGDAWRLYGSESAVRFVTLMIIIFALGIVAMVAAIRQLEGGWQRIAYTAGRSRAEMRELAEKTPAGGLAQRGVNPAEASYWPSNLVRRNVRFMFWLTLVLTLFSVGLLTFMIFVFIGMISVSAAATEDLLQARSIDVIWSWQFLGQTFVVTRPLLLLSVLFGCVAALTFATASLQDERSLSRFMQFALVYHRRSLSALAYYTGAISELQNRLAWPALCAQLADHDRTAIIDVFQLAIEQAPGWIISSVFRMARSLNLEGWAGSQGLMILAGISDRKFARISAENRDFALASAAAIPAQEAVIQSIRGRLEGACAVQ